MPKESIPNLSCDNPPETGSGESPAIVEKLVVAKEALTRAVSACSDIAISRQIKTVIRKLPSLTSLTETERFDNLSLLIARTQNEDNAKRVFIGFFDADRGSQRFSVQGHLVNYMVSPVNTRILAAEVITNTQVFGFTAVRTFETTYRPKTGLNYEYFAVRLTPRKFKSPYISSTNS